MSAVASKLPARVRPANTEADGLRVTSPAPRQPWREALAADPDVLPSQTPEWLDCLLAVGPYEDASRLYELDGGRRLVLPMVRRRDVGRRLAIEASLPAGWGVGGLVAPGGVQAGDARVVFADLAAGVRPLRTSLRPNPLQAPDWAAARPAGVAVVPRLAHTLDLGGGFEQVWKERFSGTARTAVRKALRSGLTAECDTSGRLLPTYYALFERSLERWARQQREPRALARWRAHRRDPIQKFESLAQTLGETCRTWVAWHEGRPAAAILVLTGANAHYTRGAMDKELAGPTRANYLLHSLAIEEACEAGCRFYYMGESGSSDSLAQFKTRFGARPCAHSEYHLERLPITALDRRLRGAAKRVIGFRD
jgi:GNAT acetyltransferase-like protein